MRLLNTISLLILIFIAQGQELRESFINSIDKTVVDKTIRTYYLYEILSDFSFIKKSNPTLKDDLRKVIPDSLTNYLFENMDVKPDNNYWQKNLIKSAILVNQNQVDTLLGNIIVVNKNDTKSTTKKRNKVLKSKRGRVYYFSRPVFDKKGEYALIQMGYACGNACGQKCIYLFKLINGNWEKILETSCFMS